MSAYVRNPLTYVWAFLTAITIASWLIGRDHGTAFQLDAAITFGVLLIASVKAHLVIRYFMDVRNAPCWLKRTAYGWNIVLLGLLLLFYTQSL
jgi:caa(3)-type oxidase subunit IV